jgi:Zn-dependent protease with chaperone function
MSDKKTLIKEVEKKYGVKIIILPFYLTKGLNWWKLIIIDRGIFNRASYNVVSFLIHHEVAHHLYENRINKISSIIFLPLLFLELLLIEIPLSLLLPMIGDSFNRRERRMDSIALSLAGLKEKEEKVKAEVWDNIFRF